MAVFAKCSLVVLMAMAMIGVCFGAVYKVGDDRGWSNEGPFKYNKWAAKQHFTVGDTLVFKYDSKKQNVMQVLQKDYKECKAKYFWKSQSGNNIVTLNAPGNFFYISSLPGQCEAGMKIHIKVFPAPSPSPSAPSPSPAMSSPTPAPVPASVTNTPSPAPAPVSSSVAPVPATVPRTPSPAPSVRVPVTPQGAIQVPRTELPPPPPAGPVVVAPLSPPEKADVMRNKAASIHSSGGMQVLMAVAVLALIA